MVTRYSLNADFRPKRISILQRFLEFHTSPDLAKRYRVELGCRDLPYRRRRDTFDKLAREYEAERCKNKGKPCQVSNLRNFAPIGQEPLSAMLEENCRSMSKIIRRVRRFDDYAIC